MTDLAIDDVAAARRLTERIRRVAQNVAEQVEELRTLVAEAKETEAHITLGYASWTAYLRDLFSDEPLRLARDVRKELVAELHDQGMSTRAIAPIVGVSKSQVAEDVQVSSSGHLRSEPSPAAHTWDVPAWAAPATEGEPVITSKPESVLDRSLREHLEAEERVADRVEPRKPVTGLDGKTYPAAPTPSNPRRRALTDQARDAGWEIRKAADRLTRIHEDDRFPRNREEVAAHLRGHLEHAVQVCQDLLNGFDQSRED